MKRHSDDVHVAAAAQHICKDDVPLILQQLVADLARLDLGDEHLGGGLFLRVSEEDSGGRARASDDAWRPSESAKPPDALA